MAEPELTDEQQQVVDATGSLFVEACPGAGKTRAIVARFLKRTAEEPRKGIALVSFTNAAIDEVRGRCGSRADALVAPHFVGTFDSFINRFITRPLYVRQYGQTPRFLEAWRGLARASFRLANMDKMPDLELDWFELDPSLHASIRPEWIPQRQQRTFAGLISTRRRELDKRATWLCKDLVSKGLISCGASRAMAAGYLEEAELRQRMGSLISARFSELIVDEAQDCGPEELLILELLQQFRVAIVAVADLDQSIFEFRRADPAAVRTFAASLGEPLVLDGNFRSSPAICALNKSLRHSGRQEIALGRHKESAIAVQVVAYQKVAGLPGRIEAVATTHSLTVKDVLFLSHRGNDARACAGSPETTPGTGNKVLAIARAGLVLRSSSASPRDRKSAVEVIEGALRTVAKVNDEDLSEPLEARWLRDAAVRLAVSLDPAGVDGKDFAARLRHYVNAMTWPAAVQPRDDLGNIFKAPSADDWAALGQDEQPIGFASATIHSAKGRESPAVVVVLPVNPLVDDQKQHAVHHWEKGTASELRRVLYVGVSRAEQVLFLAVHHKHLEQVTKLLRRDGVPFELHQG